MNQLVSRRKMGFSTLPLQKRKEPHAFHYLAQRTSFWLAILSLIAFVAGNMVGQHGWRVFWKSVLGREDDSLIVYTGTVTPLAQVPDAELWARYGGNSADHLFREVPQSALEALPAYNPRAGLDAVYSVGYMGSYETGAENSGSHPGVDIRVPVGTPVRAIANGVVSEVRNDGGGFGKVVVLRHPNVPDPANSRKTTVLFSDYAHLSAILVSENDIVQKGDIIALSGDTGDVSGAHLHFQIDRADAPWHPYWPFTTEDLSAARLTSNKAINTGFHREEGQQYTVNPLLYVQSNYPAVTTVAQENGDTTSSAKSAAGASSSVTWLSRAQSRLAARRITRLASLHASTPVTVRRSTVISYADTTVASSRSSAASSSATVVKSREVVVSRTTTLAVPTPVASLEITHDGSYTERGWERVRLTLLDADGNVVRSPILDRDIVLRAAYGTADFAPAMLSVLDFQDGKAEVGVLPYGRRTVVIEVQPFGVMSQPLRYTK
ncbi:MAG: M23 family metallopeptidase [Candidatus Peribacteraceae bacterium]|nr:M23 family metallopeptidase [Candidatus Peribacteraceae bacterium]